MALLYDPKKARKYIEKNKEKISYVEMGMKEDWFSTSQIVFASGEYSYDLTEETVNLLGIYGSIWATPIMRVTFKDDTEKDIPCYKEGEII